MSLPNWSDVESIDECWERSGRRRPARPAVCPEGCTESPREGQVVFPFFRRLGRHEYRFIRFGYERFVSSSALSNVHPAWLVYFADQWLHIRRGSHWSFSIRIEEGLDGAAMTFGVAPEAGGLHEFAAGGIGLSAAARWVTGFTLYGNAGKATADAPCVRGDVSALEIAQAVGYTRPGGPVEWREDVRSSKPGVYLVETIEARNRAPLDSSQLAAWIDNWHLKGKPSGVESLRRTLAARWRPDSRVLYVGKTHGSLRTRLRQFCQHKIGNTSPHAGGQSVLALTPTKDRRVWWIECAESALLERWALRAHAALLRMRFAEERDEETLLPFANKHY